MKIDFTKVPVKDIDGKEFEADVHKELGQQLYMQGQTIEECELGSLIYHTDGPVELTILQGSCVNSWVDRWPYVTRTAVKALFKH
jgi:hypothetical protein